MSEALLIRASFPRAAYAGSESGGPEELPSPARIHAAFVSAAAGGPDAEPRGHILVATERHRAAVRWLEEHRPLGLLAPETRPQQYSATRYRLRAAPGHPNATEFEPFTAIDGPVVYAWPLPDADTVRDLREIACEVTHIGRADSTVIVDVVRGEYDERADRALVPSAGRGHGHALRIAEPGRLDALEAAHEQASRPGRHGAGSQSVQAVDHPPAWASEAATRLVRFAPCGHAVAWPFQETWRMPLTGSLPAWATRSDRRVAVAVAAHRAIVAAIETDVPSFVTGRDGDGPLRGAGHLAIHVLDENRGRPELLLGVPEGVPEADRARLLDALAERPTVRLGRDSARLGKVRTGGAVWFWPTDGAGLESITPIVLDAPGPPRRGSWTLPDAVICSLAYALRGPLEAGGFNWGTGWAFRQELVAHLRKRGVRAAARRITRSPGSYLHRAAPGELVVAVDARIALGDLAPSHRGLLALGRARHLGGGLMRPLQAEWS